MGILFVLLLRRLHLYTSQIVPWYRFLFVEWWNMAACLCSISAFTAPNRSRPHTTCRVAGPPASSISVLPYLLVLLVRGLGSARFALPCGSSSVARVREIVLRSKDNIAWELVPDILCSVSQRTLRVLAQWSHKQSPRRLRLHLEVYPR